MGRVRKAGGPRVGRHGVGHQGAGRQAPAAVARALLPLLIFCLPGCAQQLDRDWERVDAEESTIIFDAPGLDTQESWILRSYNERKSVFVENAIWTGPKAKHAKAMVQFQRASPGGSQVTQADTQDVMGKLSFFQDKEIAYGPLQVGVNEIGRVEHRRLTFENVSCITFVQAWGSARGVGDRQIAGYYCADPGSALGDDTVDQVIQALRVRAE